MAFRLFIFSPRFTRTEEGVTPQSISSDGYGVVFALRTRRPNHCTSLGLIKPDYLPLASNTHIDAQF
jgi:hypothetical protein